MTIGQQIRRYRMASGMHAKDLAERAGVSRGYLSTLESGKQDTPSAKILARIADALDVSVQDLLDTQPPPVRCKHWSIQWVTHPNGDIECVSCGRVWGVVS